MKVMLLGGTDLTQAVAEALVRVPCELALVTIPSQLSISFAAGPMQVARHVDVGGWARSIGIEARSFTGLDALREFADEVRADVAVAAGWYHMIPREIRDRFPAGCLGLHASLLPALRGHAPLNWAVLAGLEETGVTLFRLEDGIDDGPVYGQRRFPVGPRTKVGDLVVEARVAAASLAADLVAGIADGSVVAVPQTGTPSYCLSRVPDDGRVDWREPAIAIDRLVRAVSQPYPGAFSFLEGRQVTFWGAEAVEDPPVVYGAPGQLLRVPAIPDPCVLCGQGILRIHAATLEGGDDALPFLRRRTYRRLTPVA